MKGAEKIFIHGEELAKQSDLSKEIFDRMNAVGNAEWQSRQYTDQKVSEIPEADPQKWVDSGFDYSYEDPNQVLPVSITVEPFGDGYGFDLGDDGYYVNNNSMINQSYAMCKIVINNTTDTDQILSFKLNQQSENAFDFGMFSLLNTDLVANVDDINTNVAITFNGYNGDIDYNVGVPVGESYLTVKYKKDGSDSQQTDTFKFKLAQDNRVTETRHMAMREDSDWLEIKVETSLSRTLSTSSRANNTDLKPEADKFEELISLVRKGIYKSIILTDGTYSSFMCLDKVSKETIIYRSLYPMQAGSHGHFYRALTFTFDESDVLTKLVAQGIGNRILTTSESSDWTPDTYTPVNKKYVDNTINEATKDSLNYKGHVSNVDALPSLGQATGVVTSNTVTIKSHFDDDAILLDTNMSLVTTLPYYLCANHSGSGGQCRIFLETEYPELIHAVVSYMQHGKTGDLYTGYLGFYIEHDPEKPVYLTAVGDNTQNPRRVYNNESGSWSRISSGSSPIPRQIVNAKSDYIIMPYGYNYSSTNYYGGSITRGTELLIKSNIPSLKLKSLVLQQGADHLCDSVKLYKETYYYNDGMKFLESDANGKMHFVKSTTSTKLNDTYTVGDNYDIYRRNEVPAWEHWSKSDSYTKAEIDAMIGEIDTVLDEILNEPELVEDNIEVPDVG